MAEFSVRWKMKHAGSAELDFHFFSEIVKVHTTYISDGLGSIVGSAVDLQKGSRSTFAYIPHEPWGTCLFLGGARSDVYLQIVEFANMESESARWSGGQMRWSGRVDVGQFIQGVARMAEDVLVQCGGVEAYSRAWGGISFPIHDLESLRQEP